MYQAILFDLDNTLYDLRSHWVTRLRAVLADVLVSHPHFDAEDLVRVAIAEQVYIERLSGFLRRQGVADEELIAAAQETYRRDWFEHMVLYEDTVHTLKALRPRFKLGLITNGPVWTQRPKIERFRLVEYLDLLIVSEEVGVAKPDPAIFQIALERLGLQPSEALFVGDSPEHDLRGAAAAGVPFVWMNPHGEQLPDGLPPPLTTITRLADLLPVLNGG